jgi:site-specific DNA-methyltransferase (adenine-specific)
MGKASEKLGRIDISEKIRKKLLPFCRLKPGHIWADSVSGHKVGVLSAEKSGDVERIFCGKKAKLIVNDPPYNIKAGGVSTRATGKISLDEYIAFSKSWVNNAGSVMDRDSHLYIWLGEDYKDNFQPLPDFMIMMRGFSGIKPRNIITMRNQRGYGTQKNWMWVRQELLHYIKGDPWFKVVYTDIPRLLKGYYKKVGGKMTENSRRSRSKFIRPGNVWVDIQQVFYRMEENVAGCYAQKPLKAIERVLESSSRKGDLVADFFAHSGTTLIAGERLGRRVYTFDSDPVYAEITIRRLEHYRKTGKTGWQNENPFGEL